MGAEAVRLGSGPPIRIAGGAWVFDQLITGDERINPSIARNSFGLMR